MSAPPAPNSIREAIAAKCSKHSLGVLSGPEPGVYDWQPTQVSIDVLAQAVWAALLAEGHIWYMRDDSALLEGSPVGEGHPVLVIPLGPDHA